MKILNTAKVCILSSLLTASCADGYRAARPALTEIMPEKAITSVLDSLAEQGRALVNKDYKKYGTDTISIKLSDFKNPQKIASRLKNLSENRNPFIRKTTYSSTCSCFDNQKTFSETQGVINSEKVFQNRNDDVVYIPVEYFGKK